MTPEQLDQIIKAFPNNGRRHHHALIRKLAQQLLEKGFESLMLRVTNDGLQRQVDQLRYQVAHPFKADCDQEVA
jgi:hypothetical protein